jgi:hypothetical protein
MSVAPLLSSVCASTGLCAAIYLERRPQLTLRHVDPLIRELTEYRDLINLKSKEKENEGD